MDSPSVNIESCTLIESRCYSKFVLRVALYLNYLPSGKQQRDESRDPHWARKYTTTLPSIELENNEGSATSTSQPVSTLEVTICHLLLGVGRGGCCNGPAGYIKDRHPWGVFCLISTIYAFPGIQPASSCSSSCSLA